MKYIGYFESKIKANDKAQELSKSGFTAYWYQTADGVFHVIQNERAERKHLEITWKVNHIPGMTRERADWEYRERELYAKRDYVALSELHAQHPEWAAMTYNED